MSDKKALCINIIANCMDIVAGFDNATPTDQPQIFSELVDTLSNYPKPTKKGDTQTPTYETIGAYLCASSVRNASKLAFYGLVGSAECVQIISFNLELSMSFLVD